MSARMEKVREALHLVEADRLKAALETICEIGETRDVEIARAALAPADRNTT